MPADYINKLARMFQDIKVSEDLNQAFKDVYRTRSPMAGNKMNFKDPQNFCHNPNTCLLLFCYVLSLDSVAIKILNAGAWARSSERVAVSLPTVVRA